MDISLRYGPGRLALRVPERHVADVVRPSIGRAPCSIHPERRKKFRAALEASSAQSVIGGTR